MKKKKADFDPIQSVGTGVTRLLSRFTPEQWSKKINSLRDRAQLGDAKATELLSIIGVASIVLGGGAGMVAGTALGGQGGGLFGSTVGGLIGASPALVGGPSKPAPTEPTKEPVPFDPEPWRKSELL